MIKPFLIVCFISFAGVISEQKVSHLEKELCHYTSQMGSYISVDLTDHHDDDSLLALNSSNSSVSNVVKITVLTPSRAVYRTYNAISNRGPPNIIT